MGADGVFPAARAFKEAADLEPKPKTADVLGHLASTLACTPRLEEARKAALKALSVEPSRVDTLSLATQLTNFTDRNQTTAGEALMQKLLQLIKQVSIQGCTVMHQSCIMRTHASVMRSCVRTRHSLF